jgi:hypothetical protein
LLSGLAAIYFAYPPEFSFHPGAAGTSLESLRLPHFSSEKIWAVPQYSQLGKGTQVKMREKQGKNEDFFEGLWIFQPKTLISGVCYSHFLFFDRGNG